MIALGAAAAVAAEGAGNLYTHMMAVNVATQATGKMFGTTFSSFLNLKGTLQQMQTAADPAVYGAMGSGLMVVKESFGQLDQAGLQVIQRFQQFSAKVVTDFAPGGSMSSIVTAFTGHMVSDLTGLGEFFGNFGHSLLSAASAMPGLAEMLLRVLADTTGWVSELLTLNNTLSLNGLSLLTLFMIYEEFLRWGGLIVGLLGRIGLASNASTAALRQQADGTNASIFAWSTFDATLRAVWSVVPNVIGALGGLMQRVIGLRAAGAAVSDFADEVGMGLSSLSTLGLVGLTAAAIGVGFLIDKMITAQSAAQRMGAAMQAAVMGMSNVNAPMAITANMAILDGQISTATQQLNQLSDAYNKTRSARRESVAATAITETQQAGASAAVSQYSAALRQQQQDLANVNQGAQWIVKTFGGTLPGALAIADAANVKLAGGILGTKNAMSVQQAQIYSLMAGYQAMSQPAGVVGQDMTAVAIQSGLAATKVSNLNSAWDEFMTNLTGGTSGLGGFVQSLKNIGSVVATATNNLGAAASISLTTGQFANALTNFGNIGSQAWQNFDQVVGSTAPQIIDWLRTAGAEGAISGPQFTNAILGMVGSLTQLAAKSPAAQAELMGLVDQADPNIKTFGQLEQTIKANGDTLNTTSKAVQKATVAMGNMSQVAANLQTVMNSQLLTTLSQATIAASGIGSAMQNYAHDLMNVGTSISQTNGDRSALIKDLESLGYTAKQAAQYVEIVQAQINQLHGKTVSVNVITNAVSGGGGVIPGVSSPGALRARGYALGTRGASSGWAWVGEAGPELVRFRGGEAVIPNNVARGYANGAGDYGGDVHVHAYIDGREVYKSVQKRAVNTQRRTGANGFTKRTR